MSVASDRLSRELGAPPPRRPRPVAVVPKSPAKGQPMAIVPAPLPPTDEALNQRLELWEDLLTLIVDPDSARVWERDRKRAILSYLLERGGFDEAEFWALGKGQRSRLFLAQYSRVSREIPQLEISAFDLDKVLKERFRQEPLTVGSAWHHGYWRSYFSHAAITHPANDGLREEFSTAWDIVRKQPAVVFRTQYGDRQTPLEVLRLDMPMVVGPLPHSDGFTMERAYLEAIGSANPKVDLKTRSLMVVECDHFFEHYAVLRPYAKDMMLRVNRDHLMRLREEGGPEEALRESLREARIVEIEWCADLEDVAPRVRGHNHDMLLSVYVRYQDDSFWDALEKAVAVDGVAMVHIHAGAEKSYKLIPRVDAFLKSKLVRARVQLVSAGGDTDTMASAACVYEAVLLGANGGSMTDIAGIALLPELIDTYHGVPVGPVLAKLGEEQLEDLRDHAINTLTCWQHSILDFLSCMGIDDIQKTSGNTMAITMTEDWLREVDALATPDFGALNAELNARRVASERVPLEVRETFKVSALLEQLEPDLPLVAAAGTLADQNANYHLENTNRSLTADFLESIYRMAAGQMPSLEDFFVEGDMGPYSLDAIRLKLSRESVAWALERLHTDAEALNYISLATPRGFSRHGAVTAGAEVSLRASETDPPLIEFTADAHGGFKIEIDGEHAVREALEGGGSLWIVGRDLELGGQSIELAAVGHGGHGHTVARAAKDGTITLCSNPRGGWTLSGFGFRAPIWHGPVSHASISLGAASEDFLAARIEGNTGLSIVSSGEGGPIRLEADEDWAWQSMQAASGHFGIHAADLRRVRDVEIKINQGAKPGKGGRLSGAKVTPTVSKARNIPAGTDALSPDPKHDIYSIEDMPAEVWLWLLYHNHCGIKITGSNYTKYVAAGMWSNFVVDYLLVDSGLGGSGNYHADSSHVGWPDIFRTMLHTHHALVSERVDLDGTGELRPIRDSNGVPFGAGGGTRLFASGGLRGESDMLKVLIAGADGLVEASIGKAVAFGCNQCGNCHLDCPRGGITTKPELTIQNERGLMRQRFRNWAVLNMVKLAVLMDALNRESGALDESGRVMDPDTLLDDIRKLRGRTDLLEMPEHPHREGQAPPAAEHDSCRVGSMTVSEPVTVHAIWEAARESFNGGNNRGGGIDFAGFAPTPLREKTCIFINTIGPDRTETMHEMLTHFDGCRFFDTTGEELTVAQVMANLDAFRLPIRERYDGDDGWRTANLRENPGDYYFFFLDLKPEVFKRYGDQLLQSPHWLQHQTKYAEIAPGVLYRVLDGLFATAQAGRTAGETENLRGQLMDFVADVREEYFTALVHVLDSRFYRTHDTDGAAPGKYAAKRRGHVVSVGEDLGAIKISGWTHTIPEYFDFDRFWARYPGDNGGIELTIKGEAKSSAALHAYCWGMHHRYPTNSPAIDEEGRGNPAGAHPFKAYNVLLKHNGEQVGVDSTSPFLGEFGYVHTDESMGPGAALYHGDSIYERKALTDTEYAAYLVDFTRRVLGLPTEDASQIISPITGLDLDGMDEARRERLKLLATNYVQLTPTGPYKFTILESRRRPLADILATGTAGARRVGFRENMDIKFLRPHEIIVSRDTAEGGVHAVANGSEAKIADIMLRVLHQQGVLADRAADLRFNMRPGGNPGSGEFGGVVEVFTAPGTGAVEINNRFGETVDVQRAGTRANELRPLADLARVVNPAWKIRVDMALDQLGAVLREDARAPSHAQPPSRGRPFGPDEALPEAAQALVEEALAQVYMLSHEDYRYLVELALPEFAGHSEGQRAVALRVLTELRKRLVLTDLGGKSLASLEYLTDGGRALDGTPEGGIYRLLDAVPPLHEVLVAGAMPRASAPSASSRESGNHTPGLGHYGRITLETRDDLAAPNQAERDVLVIDFAGFKSESFHLDAATRFVSAAVSLGWKHIVGYDFTGGPRYVGTNLPGPDGTAAEGVVIELYGREFGDFLGALLEGAHIWLYGQGQSHTGMKADSGYLFILQDTLNTCMYAAHGATINVWNSGSRFAVAGQNKVYLADGKTLAPGLKSIHFGSPNEYAFEYLMSGGDNSLHVVMGLDKPDARGELSLRHRPYAGKFFMSGAAAGRVFVFDPKVRLDPAQYYGNVLSGISQEEWSKEVGPFIAREAERRGAPIRIEGEHISVRLEGEWKRWRYDEAFAKLTPIKVVKAAQQQGIAPPSLVQIVAE